MQFNNKITIRIADAYDDYGEPSSYVEHEIKCAVLDHVKINQTGEKKINVGVPLWRQHIRNRENKTNKQFLRKSQILRNQFDPKDQGGSDQWSLS
jgi:hypothetical protein